MIKNLVFICLTIFKVSTLAQNFVVSYGFPEVTTSSGTVDPSFTPTLSGLSCGSFSANGTSLNPSASGRFSFTGWPLGGINATDDYSNFTGALSPTVYYEVTLTPDQGYTLSLNSATFTIRRSGTGIRHYCMRSDQDNYINNLAAFTGTTTKLSVIPGDIFSWNYDSVSASSDQRGSEIKFGTAFNALTNKVTFRIYAWNAESSGGSFAIDNFSFIGSLTNSVSTVGVLSEQKNPSINLYPNPSEDGKFILQKTNNTQKMELFSSEGKLLREEFPKAWEGNYVLDLSAFKSGLYLVKIYSEASVVLKKLIINQK
ncbi:hypothetical protein CNR22_08570 [Sphingobacteriaceae bacterium]|nr:hypothetical protein CNR22_08570 [Sphingobacteriaceae bacterium]